MVIRGKVFNLIRDRLESHEYGENDALYPVLKHGPRSLTQMRVRRIYIFIYNFENLSA